MLLLRDFSLREGKTSFGHQMIPSEIHVGINGSSQGGLQENEQPYLVGCFT